MQKNLGWSRVVSVSVLIGSVGGGGGGVVFQKSYPKAPTSPKRNHPEPKV